MLQNETQFVGLCVVAATQCAFDWHPELPGCVGQQTMASSSSRALVVPPGSDATALGGGGVLAVAGSEHPGPEVHIPERRAADHAGQFIDHPQLAQLSAMLKAIDAGDRIVKGRLELFSCTRRKLSQRQQQELRRRAPRSLTESPLGPMTSDSAQNLLANLVSLMSMLFVDYDCTSITPDDFAQCPDKHAVVNVINHSLASVVDRVHQGFLSEFWQIVQDAIDVVNSEIYAFSPKSGSFEPTDNSLSAFHYFFTDVQRGRILFIGNVTKSRGAAMCRGNDAESDVSLSHQHSASSIASKEQGSSMGSSLQEGDFEFGSDVSGDDRMMD